MRGRLKMDALGSESLADAQLPRVVLVLYSGLTAILHEYACMRVLIGCSNDYVAVVNTHQAIWR